MPGWRELGQEVGHFGLWGGKRGIDGEDYCVWDDEWMEHAVIGRSRFYIGKD